MPLRNYIEDVFTEYGIRISQSGYKSILFVCPFHPQGKHQHNAVIYTNNGGWKCFNPLCGSAGFLQTIIKRMEECSHSKSLAILKNKFGLDLDLLVFEDEKNYKTSKKFYPLPEYYESISNKNPYLSKHGFTAANLNMLNVGVIKHDKRKFIIPYKHNGVNVGYAIKPWDERANFPGDFPVNDYLYALDNARQYDEVYIVEGHRDVWRVWEFNLPCVGLNGASMSDSQLNLIVKYFSSVILCLDGDIAGAAGTIKVFKKLQGLMPVKAVMLPEGKDPCDFKEKKNFTSQVSCDRIETLEKYKNILMRNANGYKKDNGK